jgi:hypothetical protein
MFTWVGTVASHHVNFHMFGCVLAVIDFVHTTQTTINVMIIIHEI